MGTIDYCCGLWLVGIWCDRPCEGTHSVSARCLCSDFYFHDQKYLFPHLQPPSSTAYEEDRDALTAQFDAAEALLKDIRSETSAVKVAVENQQEKVDKATTDVEAAVKQMIEGESRARNEMREIREEVNNIREMIPKVISSASFIMHKR
jgi:hypothetical protein